MEAMYTTCAKQSHFYERKRPFKQTEILNKTGANIEWMLNESKVVTGCLLNGTGTGSFYDAYCIIFLEITEAQLGL